MKAAETWKKIRPPLVVSLVTTIDQEGRPNASPKTWWTPTSYDPPLMLISLKPDSDSARNVGSTGVWVWHLPDARHALKVLHTAKPLDAGENELDDVGLPWEWREHAMLPHPVPVVRGMPFAICWVQSAWQSGDHVMFEGQVGVSGGYDLETGAANALLHRSRNTFMGVTPEFEVEAY